MATSGPGSPRENPLRLWPGVIGAISSSSRVVVAPFVPGAALVGILAGTAAAAVIFSGGSSSAAPPGWNGSARPADRAGRGRDGCPSSIRRSAERTEAAVSVPASSDRPAIPGGGGRPLASILAGARWATMATAIFLGSGIWVLARIDGIKGDAGAQLAWRWTPTAEERLLAATRDETLPPPSATTANTPTASSTHETRRAAAKPAVAAGRPADHRHPAVAAPAVAPILWSGFRGRPHARRGRRPAHQHDWNVAKPVQVWRRRVGPGWSSFAVAGDLIFTQEQRGTTRWSPPTDSTPANPCGATRTRRASTSRPAAPDHAAHRPSTTAVSMRWARPAS